MSSLLTVYRMSESLRADFERAYVNEKKVTYKSGLGGKKEVVTGERFLWEYLDEAASQRIEWESSGFLFVDYFFTYMVLPEETRVRLESAARGDHYLVIDTDLASAIRDHLAAHRPSMESLTEFAPEEGKMEEGYPEALLSVHDRMVEWMELSTPDAFLVLHLTF